jgi:DNA-binding MarR family transcriptional regulator
MDTYTAAAAEVARSLDTSTPRVVRAAKRLGLDAQANGRMALTSRMVERLTDELGRTPSIPGLSVVEVKVLAALSRSPFGLSSARVVAGQAGVSPTAASRALRSLEHKDLVRREEAVIAAGRARTVQLLHANRRAERWLELAPALIRVLPARRAHAQPGRVPPRLRHLFWNTAPSQLDIGRAGPYIARRLLSTMDFDGLAWGAANLRPADWEQAAHARGLDNRVRTLAHNLAREQEDRWGSKVEFFHADERRPQHLLEEPKPVGDLHVAGLKDLMAMKLKVVGDRGEMRDYYDIKVIEEQAGLTVEDGIALFLERYDVNSASETVRHIIAALGYLDDLEEDDALPVGKDELTDWWRKRQARLVRYLSRNPL